MTEAPRKSVFSKLRRTLFGAPIPTSRAHHEKLSAVTGLAVFSSDALSSVAYATEAILSVLILFAATAVHLQIWITVAVAGLIAIIANSYRQTIRAYPHGGGSYIVASENLGETPGVIAGAALLIDYVLTVAVSIAAGVAAVSSAYPPLHEHLVGLSIFFIAVVAWANLRGLRESGALFAFPTYGFVITMFLVIAAGLYRVMTGVPVEQKVIGESIGIERNVALWFILLRAFSAGCTALTGIEAVADGVQSFRAPEAKTATKTLIRMAVILTIMFLGIGYVALHLPVVSLLSAKNPEYRTLTSQIAAFAFGANNVMFYVAQFFTAAILILAANTAFADFPRLSSFLARDGYLPRYMSRVGDRLVFHNGIIVLAVAASVLVVIFQGELDNLLPLYAVGVFTAFTLSQAGMVMHWKNTKEPGWRRSMVSNIVGSVLCFAVLLIILLTKFAEGAWIIVVIMPLICIVLIMINRRYRNMSAQMEIESVRVAPITSDHMILLLVPRMHKGIISALHYAQHLKGTCQAVHVTINEKALPQLMRQWEEHTSEVPLVVLPSPYRSLLQPVLDYVDELRAKDPNVEITVVVPEAVSTKWYHKLLHENVALQLKQALARRRNVVVANVRYFLQ
jgi:amino acid transporter